jgi:electron transfer flavoprotein alpha subunit
VRVLRTVYAGKLREHLVLKPATVGLFTVRPGCREPAPAGGKATEVEPLAAPERSEGRGRRFVERILADVGDVDIADAAVLVSVGRGVGKEENLAIVREFADSIGATLSCSRPVVDKGWLPKSRQVGSSGRVVRPDVYIALGISGAYQHVIGMSRAGTTIAVNRDPAAPIFDVAQYGIVADMFDVIPLLKEKLAGR